MWRRIIPLIALAGSPALADGPIAEVLCAPRETMQDRLTNRYRADLSAAGIRDRETVLEIWTDPEGRWTLVQRYAGGLSCILAVGEHWIPSAPPS